MDKPVPKQIGMFQAYFPDPNKPYTINYLPGFDNAFVSSDKPNVVNIDPYIQYEGVFPHEFHHQLTFKAADRYNIKKPEVNFWLNNLANFGLNPLQELRKFEQNIKTNAKGISKLLKEKTGKELPEFSRLWNADEQVLDEILAELSAVESILNMDFTKDKKLRKALFNNNEKVAQVYRSLTSGRQDRLDAKDIAPYTVQIQEVQTKEEPSTLRNILKYVNPFGDSTKD